MLEYIEEPQNDERIPLWLKPRYHGGHIFAEFEGCTLMHMWRVYEHNEDAYHIYDHSTHDAKFRVLSEKLLRAIQNASRVNKDMNIFTDVNRLRFEASDDEVVFSQEIGAVIENEGALRLYNLDELKRWLKSIGLGRVDFFNASFRSPSTVTSVCIDWEYEAPTPSPLLRGDTEYTVALSALELHDLHLKAKKWAGNKPHEPKGAFYLHFQVKSGKVSVVIGNDLSSYIGDVNANTNDMPDRAFMVHRKAIESLIMAVKVGKTWEYDEILIHVHEDGRVVMEAQHGQIRVASLPTPLLHDIHSKFMYMWNRAVLTLTPTINTPASKYGKDDMCYIEGGNIRMVADGEKPAHTFLRKYVPDDLYRYSVDVYDSLVYIQTPHEKVIIAPYSKRY